MFIWNWITGFLGWVWYMITLQWLSNWIFGKGKTVTDLSCHLVHFLPRIPCSEETLKKEFREIFGGDCQLSLVDKKIPYLDRTFGKHLREPHRNHFNSYERFLALFNEPHQECCNLFRPLRCIINSHSLEKMVNSEAFNIIWESDWTGQIKSSVYDKQQQEILPVYVANELATKQIEDRCRKCGADISSTITLDLDGCSNCSTPIGEALRDPKGKFNARDISVNIHKTLKQLAEEIDYAA